MIVRTLWKLEASRRHTPSSRCCRTARTVAPHLHKGIMWIYIITVLLRISAGSYRPFRLSCGDQVCVRGGQRAERAQRRAHLARSNVEHGVRLTQQVRRGANHHGLVRGRAREHGGCATKRSWRAGTSRPTTPWWSRRKRATASCRSWWENTSGASCIRRSAPSSTPRWWPPTPPGRIAAT